MSQQNPLMCTYSKCNFSLLNRAFMFIPLQEKWFLTQGILKSLKFYGE